MSWRAERTTRAVELISMACGMSGEERVVKQKTGFTCQPSMVLYQLFRFPGSSSTPPALSHRRSGNRLTGSKGALYIETLC